LGPDGKKEGKQKKGGFAAYALIGFCLILAGVIVAGYPWIKAAYFEFRKSNLLSRWERAAAAGELPAAREYSPSYSSEDFFEGIFVEETDPGYDEEYIFENVVGVITIEKINLRSVILHGVTSRNLDLAICVVDGSPGMGREGNYCLAGHKSRIYGRHFNRLQELRAGDIILLSDGVDEYRFAAVHTEHISPEDDWVLMDTPGETIVTLITCDYSVTPVGRFIVVCEPAK